MSKKRIAIYGGNGFIGSHIAAALSRENDFCVLCLSRTGHKPAHLREVPWSANVRWCQGDALKPDRTILQSAEAVVVSIGSPPLPTLTTAG